MPMYVCMRKGVKLNGNVLNYGDKVESAYNPHLSYFIEESIDVLEAIKVSKKSKPVKKDKKKVK